MSNEPDAKPTDEIAPQENTTEAPPASDEAAPYALDAGPDVEAEPQPTEAAPENTPPVDNDHVEEGAENFEEPAAEPVRHRLQWLEKEFIEFFSVAEEDTVKFLTWISTKLENQ